VAGGLVTWGFVALLALLSAPLLREALRPRMNAAARAEAPGDFATLSRGLTHYRWFGPEHGAVTVCVHGLTTPSFVWDGLAPGLAAAGRRVLVYDLYGRGFSDRPEGAQVAAFFITQLRELLADQGVAGPVTLIGYSMGGAIATEFSARHPGRVQTLILIAPAGLGHDLGPVARIVARGGPFALWLMLAAFPRNFQRGCEAERALPSSVPGIVDLQQAQLRWRGFVPAVARSLSGILAQDLSPVHARIAQNGPPVHAIWGAADTVIPIACKDRLAALNPAARQSVIAGAGHGLTYTHTAQVLAACLDGDRGPAA
jgi:pimeloyl-ACP methyl ester carboxylesterase